MRKEQYIRNNKPQYRRVTTDLKRRLEKEPRLKPTIAATVKFKQIHDEVRAGRFPDIDFKDTATQPLKFKKRERVAARKGKRRIGRNTKQSAQRRELDFSGRHLDFSAPGIGAFSDENVFEFD